MSVKKPVWSGIQLVSLQGQCENLIDQHHIEMSAEAIKMVCSIPIIGFIKYAELAGWVYKETSTFKGWFSKSIMVLLSKTPGHL